MTDFWPFLTIFPDFPDFRYPQSTGILALSGWVILADFRPVSRISPIFPKSPVSQIRAKLAKTSLAKTGKIPKSPKTREKMCKIFSKSGFSSFSTPAIRIGPTAEPIPPRIFDPKLRREIRHCVQFQRLSTLFGYVCPKKQNIEITSKTLPRLRSLLNSQDLAFLLFSFRKTPLHIAKFLHLQLRVRSSVVITDNLHISHCKNTKQISIITMF